MNDPAESGREVHSNVFNPLTVHILPSDQATSRGGLMKKSSRGLAFFDVALHALADGVVSETALRHLAFFDVALHAFADGVVSIWSLMLLRAGQRLKDRDRSAAYPA